MNSPQWPGQPPGGPGYPPPVPPGPPLPGGPGFPAPPPPRGGGGALVPLLIIGMVAVLAVIGVGAFLVLRSDDDDPARTISQPTYTPYTPSSSPEPTPSQTSSGGGSDPSSVLGPTIRTAKGNTFTRAGTRTATCTSRANPKLRTALRSYPCVGVMHSAVYASPSKQIITSVSIARFSSPTAASNISRITNDKGWPLLLTPSDASGLPQPRADPAYWTRSWTQGSNVIYAQSYWSTGADTGGRTGSVFATAGELGVEVTNSLLWTD
ncbi:hypothetical protein BZB76_5614 [Actinomadura pelletieri DSM 43383]|uniref:Uncharacterized protein n=1 Tax=Actinomadura pelletieri DSM 43383 TaxID=1120940 RepID=A0A495QH04_9ACTN|nr:hypothetical protein [Actinomadura pelletieri]RKS71128.1 hypothetical protein BZB76_5614 [Actinomadura pelletieri DSM 43383]